MLGIFVGSLGLTLGILVLALDITLQVLGSTLKRVIVVDGLVDDDCANSGSDSDQNLQSRQQRSVTYSGGHRVFVQCTAGLSSFTKVTLPRECRGGKVFIQAVRSR